MSKTSPGARPYRSPLPLTLAGIILCSLAFTGLFDAWYRWFSGSKRNPHFRRAWVEHVTRTPPAAPGERVILLISHSQGWGREVEDTLTYAALLEDSLQVLGSTGRVRVVNWSVPAGRGAEFIVLASAARRIRPSAIVLVASGTQFRPRRLAAKDDGESSTAWPSDIHYLLARRNIRDGIAPAARHDLLTGAERLDSVLGGLWRAWRLRTLPVHVMTRWEPLKPFARNDTEPTWFPPREGRRIIVAPLGTAMPDPSLVEAFLTAATAAAPSVVWINTPVHSRWRKDVDPGIDHLRAACSARNVAFLDASDAIPDAAFFTASHFDIEGHRLMAVWIAGALPP